MCDAEGFIPTLENFKDTSHSYSSGQLEKLINDNIAKYTKHQKNFNNTEDTDAYIKILLTEIIMEAMISPLYKEKFQAQVDSLVEEYKYKNFDEIADIYRLTTHIENPSSQKTFTGLIEKIKTEYDDCVQRYTALLKQRNLLFVNNYNLLKENNKSKEFKESKEDGEVKANYAEIEANIAQVQSAIVDDKKKLLEAYVITAPNLLRIEKYFNPLIDFLFNKYKSQDFESALEYFKVIHSKKSNINLVEIYNDKISSYLAAQLKNKELIENARLDSVLAYQLIHDSADYSLLPDNEKIIRTIPNPGFMSQLKGGWIGFKAALGKGIPAKIKQSESLITFILLVISFIIACGAIVYLLPLLTAPLVYLYLPVIGSVETLIKIFFTIMIWPVVFIAVLIVFFPPVSGIIRTWSAAYKAQSSPHLGSVFKHVLLSPLFLVVSMYHSIRLGYTIGEGVDAKKLEFNPYDKFSHYKRPSGWGYHELKNHLFSYTIAEMAERCPKEMQTRKEDEEINPSYNALFSGQTNSKQYDRNNRSVELTEYKIDQPLRNRSSSSPFNLSNPAFFQSELLSASETTKTKDSKTSTSFTSSTQIDSPK